MINLIRMKIGTLYSIFLKRNHSVQSPRKLFDVSIENPDRGWLNIQADDYQCETQMILALEELWAEYEPYADANFREDFARDPNPKFWEMFLTTWLLQQGKTLFAGMNLRAEHGNYY